MDRKHAKKYAKNVNFPWWANGPYSSGLGSCAGVILLPGSGFVLVVSSPVARTPMQALLQKLSDKLSYAEQEDFQHM